MADPTDDTEPRVAVGHTGVPKLPDAWPTDTVLARERLAEAEANRSKQLTLLLVGTTPAALLPVLAAVWTDNNALAVVFVVGAMIIQTVRWRTAAGIVNTLETELEDALVEQEGSRLLES
ncbi:MAG: hypothetical protein P8L30_10265 [Longimicrobiales bacterium]|nr:hypothetical protein [Longimicrobiales bacterium]